MAMTDEQLNAMSDEELQSIVDSDSTSQAKFTDDDLNAMSDEQLQAIVEGKEPAPPEPDQETIGSAEVMLRGGGQGLFGFGDEIEAGAKAALRYAGEENAEWTDIYNDELDQARLANAEAAEQSPVLFHGAEIATGIASTIAAPGSIGLRGAMIYGGISGVGYSNAKKTSELVKDAALGGALGFAGDKLAKGTGALWNKVVANSDPAVTKAMQAMGESTAPGAIRFEQKVVETVFKERSGNLSGAIGSKKVTEAAAESIDSLLGREGHIIKEINKKKDEIGEEMTHFLKSVDEGKSFNIKDKLTALKEELKEFRKGSGQDAAAVKKIEDNILDKLDKGELMIKGETLDPNNLTPGQLINLSRKIKDTLISFDADGIATIRKMSKEVDGAMVGFSKSLADDFKYIGGNAEKKILGPGGELNKRWESLYKARDNAPTSREALISIHDISSPNITSEQNKKFIDGLIEADPDFAQKMVDDVNPISNFYGVTQMAQEFNLAISRLFQAKAAMQLLGPAGGLLAVGRGGMIGAADIANRAGKSVMSSIKSNTQEVLGASLSKKASDIATIPAKIAKLPRTVAGVIDNQADVVGMVSKASVPIAMQLNRAINERDVDQIRQIMNQGAEQFPDQFEEGMGFDGKITGEQEALRLKESAKALPVRDRWKANSDITNGIIPNLERSQPETLRDFTRRQRDEKNRKI